MRILACLAFLMGGCGDNPSGQDMSMDLSMSPADLGACNSDLGARTPSACGRPCDTGNSKGVGKFCTTGADCMGNGQATICSTVQNTGTADDTYFCTIASICDPAGDVAMQCGEDSACLCRTTPGGMLCGCVHARCAGQGLIG